MSRDRSKFKIETNLACLYAYQAIMKLIDEKGVTRLSYWHDDTDLDDPDSDLEVIRWNKGAWECQHEAAKEAAEFIYDIDGRVYVKVGGITLIFMAQYPNYGPDDAPEVLMDWVYPANSEHPYGWEAPDAVDFSNLTFAPNLT